MKKVELYQLTKDDVENLFDNRDVWGKVTEFMSNQSMDIVNDYLSKLGADTIDYSIGDSSYRDNYLLVTDPYCFIENLKEFNDDYGLLEKATITKGESLIKMYDDGVASEDDLQEFSDKVAETLLECFINEYDCIYNEELVKENILNYCEDIYGEDAYYDRDTNKVFYISCD